MVHGPSDISTERWPSMSVGSGSPQPNLTPNSYGRFVCIRTLVRRKREREVPRSVTHRLVNSLMLAKCWRATARAA